LDFDAYRLYSMYGEGVAVSDIALVFGWASTGAVYAHLKQFPAKYKEAKILLLQKRNAKYRRVGALSVDIQLETLETMKGLLEKEQSLLEEIESLELKTIEGRYDTKLLDKNIAEDVKVEIQKHNRRIEQIHNALESIGNIRAEIKDISNIGENAERRADLNEGKPTERVQEVGREPTESEWKAYWQAQREAGNGLDNGSIVDN